MSEQKKQEVVNYEKLTGLTGFQAEMIAVLHNTIAKGTTVTELAYFLSVCKSLDLNPLNREVWCYKDTIGNLLVFTGRDGFLSKAQKNSKYNGLRSSEVRENDVFVMDIANNNIEHTFGTSERGKILGAYAIAFVKDQEPTIEWADFNDYNKGKNTWTKFASDMIKKVAECHALKKAFGISNLVSEYDFEIKNGIAYAGHSKPEIPKDKSEERLFELINTRKSRKELEKLLPELITQEHRDAYDKKFEELK